MFFDLNFPIQKISVKLSTSKKDKGKGKAPQKDEITWTEQEISAIEARIDLLIHLGYSVIAFSQTVQRKVDPKTHVNFLDGFLTRLRPRQGMVYLKRLNIILDQESEKGFGLINASLSLFNGYDLISLVPTTHNTFSSACLTHSLPSQLTAHIISLPLTLPRLPYHLKHTLIRTAIKNGAVFEINYVGALGGDQDAAFAEANAAETGVVAKRNWWASTRELVRVTKGKGLIVSGGVVNDADLRAPRDVANLITVLGLAQDTAHSAMTKTPNSLVIRAETRKTYRAVFSEPKVIFPGEPVSGMAVAEFSMVKNTTVTPMLEASTSGRSTAATAKRPRDDSAIGVPEKTPPLGSSKKKKRKHNQEKRNDITRTSTVPC